MGLAVVTTSGTVRTFYWQPATWSAAERTARRIWRPSRHRGFAVGNAGDLWARDVIELEYGTQAVNVPNDGRRLLAVGSIAHCVRTGDIVAGVGAKGDVAIPSGVAGIDILGVRGPLTAEAYRRAGYDVSGIRFIGDPGLLIRRYVEPMPAVAGRRICIPHYRHRHDIRRRLPRDVAFVDIDARPLDVARAIQSADVVYSSSLHGIVFAHALERPCVPFHPGPDENLMKYADHFLAVGLGWDDRLPPIEEALGKRTGSPVAIKDLIDSIRLPATADLVTSAVLER